MTAPRHRVPVVASARQRRDSTSGGENSRLSALTQIPWQRGTARLRVVEERQAGGGSHSRPTERHVRPVKTAWERRVVSDRRRTSPAGRSAPYRSLWAQPGIFSKGRETKAIRA